MSSMQAVIQSCEKGVEKFDDDIGAPQFTYSPIYETFLTKSYEEIKKMDKEDCIEASYCLAQYSLYLTKKINAEKAKMLVRKNLIQRIVAKEYGSYSKDDKYTKYDVVYFSIVAQNSAASDLDNEMLESQAIIQHYDGIIDKISEIARIFKNMSYTK